MGFGAQLAIVLEERMITVSELAKKTGIPASTLYSIIDRDTDSVGIDKVKKIEKAVGAIPGGVVYNLLYGVKPEEAEVSTRQYDFYSLSSDIREELLYRKYRTLNVKGQVKILEYIDDLTKIDEYKKELDKRMYELERFIQNTKDGKWGKYVTQEQCEKIIAAAEKDMEEIKEKRKGIVSTDIEEQEIECERGLVNLDEYPSSVLDLLP